MLKQYVINGKQYQYEEGEQPEGAMELKVKAKEPKNKARTTKNKTRKKAEAKK